MKVAEQIPPTSCSGRTSIHHPFSPYPGVQTAPRDHGLVAQSEERAVVNRWVAGSIPAGTAIRDRAVRCWQPEKTGTALAAPLDDAYHGGDICRRSSVGRAPRPEVCAGSSPAVCARCRVAPGQCEPGVVMAYTEMTMLAENCACPDASRPV